MIESGWLAEEISRVAALIRPYVEDDANRFYSAEEFDTAVEALQSYCALRSESIRGQLDGTIPSTTEGQRADSSALVDTGALNISDMGVMNTGGDGDRQGGGPGGNFGGGMPGGGNMPSMQGGGSVPSMPQDGSMPSMPEGFSFGSGSFDPSAFGSGSFTPPGNVNTGAAKTEAAAGNTATDTAETETAAETAEKAVEAADAAAPAQAEAQESERKDSFRPGFDPSGNMGTAPSGTNWILFGILPAALLAAILLIMKLPGRER